MIILNVPITTNLDSARQFAAELREISREFGDPFLVTTWEDDRALCGDELIHVAFHVENTRPCHIIFHESGLVDAYGHSQDPQVTLEDWIEGTWRVLLKCLAATQHRRTVRISSKEWHAAA